MPSLSRLSAGVLAHAAGICAVALAAACTPPSRDTAPPAAGASRLSAQLARLGDADGLRLVDLTHALGPDSLYWPTGSPFEHRRLGWNTDPGYWYAAGEFSSPEHLGTHLDAPIHFAEDGWTSAEIPVERLVAPGVTIDITGRAAAAAEATLQPSDIDAWERQHGRLDEGVIVLVRTGWSARWPDWSAYYGSETPMDTATLRFPGVAEAAAEALTVRGAAGVGIDTASIDPGRSTAFEAHRVLAAANIYALENLTGLDALPPSGFLVLALPMKIVQGTGGPTRVVALVPAGNGERETGSGELPVSD